VLNYADTDYYFYLHDNSWNIHYGKTSAEHSANKAKYLN
jgi:cell division protein YceG involved in septum cleavage